MAERTRATLSGDEGLAGILPSPAERGFNPSGVK